MKTFTWLLAILLGANQLQAVVVSPALAQKVATNFYAQNFSAPQPDLTIAYTERDPVSGAAVYYVFNVDRNRGFVIVSADDAAMPIIGYNDKGSYTNPAPGTNTNFVYWMQERKQEIIAIRNQNLPASSEIHDLWTSYSNNVVPNNTHRVSRVMGSFPSNTFHLVNSIWNQSPYYNAWCPGGSVTGCVSTAMSQIMWYWSYPSHGLFHSAYLCIPPFYKNNYGLLSADYDTSNYNWAAMPREVNSPNNMVAKLCYDAGVSVGMDYDPSGSGSEVLTNDAIGAHWPDTACAQRSYVKFFGFNAATISGKYQSSYSLSSWESLLENELNNNRPIQYVGTDPVNGGHTWVCDGYNSTPDFHMNWGWDSAYDGWYSVSSLNPGPFNFSQNHEVLIGIEPPPVKAWFTASPLTSCSAPLTVNFTDRSMIPSPASPITGWKWTFTGGSPSSSNLQNPSITYNSPGSYSVKLRITNSLGSDSVTFANYVVVGSPSVPPLAQGFETQPFAPSGWYVVNNPNLLAWWSWGTPGGYGSSAHSIHFDNCANGMLGEYDQIYTPIYNFTSIAKPELYFDVAYAPYDVSSSPPESDTLVVYYSTNCGASWNQIYSKGGLTLATTGGKDIKNGGAHTDAQGCFYPLNNNWRTDTIHIPAIAGAPAVMFSFENRSGNGSTLFIDNVNIPGLPLNVADAVEQREVTVYPNPSNGNFRIGFSGQTENWYDLTVYNMLGQQVMHQLLQNVTGGSVYSVNMPAVAKGVYSLLLKNDREQIVKQITVL